jgi:uncharacterized protein
MPALIDTSAVLAAVDRNDVAHDRVVAALRVERSTILLPTVVLPEVAFLLDACHGAVTAASVMAHIARGNWPIENLETTDLERATELMARYADSRIGFVDAAITALAERLAAPRIYTLDRRHFTLIRPRHTDVFEVLPGA